MENYNLKEDEVVLYKGYGHIANSKDSTQIILTNYNFVFITTQKKLLRHDDIIVETFAKEDVKWYEDKPHIKTNGKTVEMYFKTCEKDFVFSSKSELHKFTSQAIKLTTGKSTAQRTLEKAKNTIDMIDNSLGIDTRSAFSSKDSIGSVVVKTGASAIIHTGAKLLSKKNKGIKQITKEDKK